MRIKIIAIRETGNHPMHITYFKTEYNDVIKRSEIYNMIKNGGEYETDLYPYPKLVTAVSSLGTKYVHSEGDGTSTDDLLKLPRF